MIQHLLPTSARANAFMTCGVKAIEHSALNLGRQIKASGQQATNVGVDSFHSSGINHTSQNNSRPYPFEILDEDVHEVVGNNDDIIGEIEEIAEEIKNEEAS